MLAARAIADPDFLTIAEPLVDVTEGPLLEETEESIEALGARSPLEALDETQQFVGAASTIRRHVQKVGRNDPCYCEKRSSFTDPKM